MNASIDSDTMNGSRLVYASRAYFEGSGFGVAGVAGAELLRDTKVRLLLELRIDLPLFAPSGSSQSSSYVYGPSGLQSTSSAKPRSSYGVPLAVACSFMF